jgi:hypothetical protein
MLPGLLAAVALAISQGENPPPSADDEARIEEMMGFEAEAREAAEAAVRDAAATDATAPADGTFPPKSGSAIEFDDLPKLVGYSIRVHIGPRVRVGSVEKADKRAVTMKSPMGGGFAQFTLSRAQIDAIEIL